MDYFAAPIAHEKLSMILNSIGLEVEGYEEYQEIKGNLAGLITGEVLSVDKHPNADRLSVTTVNIGGEQPLQIVCGAPNVAAGQKVIVSGTLDLQATQNAYARVIPCFVASGSGGTPSNGSAEGIGTWIQTERTVTTQGVLTPGAGTWDVGVCARNGSGGTLQVLSASGLIQVVN